MNMRVAIHQPNFLPWLGYFHKLCHCDRFVVLDTVQFQKTSGNWGNRVKLLLGGTPRWCTMPIVRNYHGLRSFREMRIQSTTDWRGDLLKTLHSSYGRCAHFRAVFAVLESVVADPTDHLADYNQACIRTIAGHLNVDTGKMVLASELGVDGQATDLLVRLVGACGGTGYLCGGGSAGYLEPAKFVAAGLELVFQDFTHPVYPQSSAGPFVPGLSIVDALMHCGFAGVAELLRAPAAAQAA